MATKAWPKHDSGGLIKMAYGLMSFSSYQSLGSTIPTDPNAIVVGVPAGLTSKLIKIAKSSDSGWHWSAK